MPIEYYRKDSYGRPLLWLADKKLATLFTQLTRKKTITAKEVNVLIEMVSLMSGVDVKPLEVVAPEK